MSDDLHPHVKLICEHTNVILAQIDVIKSHLNSICELGEERLQSQEILNHKDCKVVVEYMNRLDSKLVELNQFIHEKSEPRK